MRRDTTSHTEQKPAVPSILRMVGKGIYTPSEASRYAKIPASTMRNWLFGTNHSEQLFHRQFDDVPQVVTFLDFIQTLGVRALRANIRPISMPALRYAIQMAQDKYKIEYPLASQHSRIIQLDKHLVIELDDKRYVEATRKHPGHFVIPQIIEELGERVLYNRRTGMAEAYMPFESNGIQIAMNPGILFGAPYLPSCGYSAETLAHAVVTEGGVKAAAEAYGVKVAEIKAASKFISSLQKSAA